MRTCTRCNTSYANDIGVCAKDGESLPDPDLVTGETVGEYKVEGRLGAGAFGSVFRAVHPLIGKKVAIKVLNHQFSMNPEMVSRFISEARAVNEIGHKNIIDIFSFGQLPDGRQYYVMELLKGVTLDRYLKQRGRLIMQEAIPILRGVGRALDAAHKAGIAHRDLKPENILIADDDGRAFPKLLDFGIAKLMGSREALHKTRTGTPMGTPYYMSPEQCRGRDVDHRTDIYSFGVMTYQLLTGKLPFTGEDFLEIINKQVSGEAVRPSTIHEDLPAGVDDALAWMMKKDPAQRAPSLGAAVDALEKAAATRGVSVHSDVTRLQAVQRQELASTFGAAPPSRPSLSGIDKTIIGTGTEPPVSGTQPPGHGTSPGAKAASPPPDTLGTSMLGAEVQAQPAKRSRVWLVGVGAAVAAGAVVVAVMAGGGGGSPPPAAAAPSVPSAKPAAAPVPGPVTITVEGTAGGELVDPAGTKLGTVPASFTLPRGEASIELRVTKAGFADDKLAVVPDHDQKLTVLMREAPAAAAPAATKPSEHPKPAAAAVNVRLGGAPASGPDKIGKPADVKPTVVEPPKPAKPAERKNGGLPEF